MGAGLTRAHFLFRIMDMRYLYSLLIALGLLLPSVPVSATTQIYDYQEAADSISEFYYSYFSNTPVKYHDPEVVVVDAKHEYHGDCGDADITMTGFYAFYCQLDETIVLDSLALKELADVDSFIPYAVMAHEWGHHVEKLIGLDVPEVMCGGSSCMMEPIDAGDADVMYLIEFEQLADCMSGAWMGYLDAEGVLHDSDLANYLFIMAKLLDGPADRGPYSHGTAAQRMEAQLRGYHYGLLGCASLQPIRE